MATAQRWCEGAGLHGVTCGRTWFDGLMNRAKRYKPAFGELKWSKIDVMRAEKQCFEVIPAFFDRVVAIYAHHARLVTLGWGMLLQVHAPFSKWARFTQIQRKNDEEIVQH